MDGLRNRMFYPLVLPQKGIIYFLRLFVIQSEAKNLENIKEDVYVDALEILPPFGRLNDTLC